MIHRALAQGAPIASARTSSASLKKARWQPKFLAALATVPNVRYACEEAGIARPTAYRERQRDEAFAVAWSDALNEALDTMERVAHQRGTAGQEVPKTTTRTRSDGTTETVETKERHVSDSLLMFMLKRYRPEFRETFKLTGADGGPIEHRVTVIDETIDEFYAELDRLALNGDSSGS